jgi:type IV secretory pathway TraG/TraD family ATPase VirD4
MSTTEMQRAPALIKLPPAECSRSFASAAGKTSGYIIPTVLTQGGPVVAYSTKFDIARNTSLARSRMGTVWHYDPTGGGCSAWFQTAPLVSP